MYATAVTARPKHARWLAQRALQWPAVTTVAHTPFRVHSTFCTCCTEILFRMFSGGFEPPKEPN